jgi:hypothetical protein
MCINQRQRIDWNNQPAGVEQEMERAADRVWAVGCDLHRCCRQGAERLGAAAEASRLPLVATERRHQLNEHICQILSVRVNSERVASTNTNWRVQKQNAAIFSTQHSE